MAYLPFMTTPAILGEHNVTFLDIFTIFIFHSLNRHAECLSNGSVQKFPFQYTRFGGIIPHLI